MPLPNYNNGSIVNLMSSILTACGATSPYAPLPMFAPATLAEAKNIVLVVLDGLGYEFLTRRRADTILHTHLRGKLTSVFPSTTAAGITTFLTGLAPQQHAATGWFMYLKEFGSVVTTLYCQPRCAPASFCRNGIKADLVYGAAEGLSASQRATYSLQHKMLEKAEFNLHMNRCQKKLSYRTLPEFFKKLKKLITSRKHERKFVYAYWSGIDTLCHKHGTFSVEAARHFDELVERFNWLARAIRETDTTVIITADHGLMDTEPASMIETKRHPQLREMLALPLCGEPRVAYCYVRPSKAVAFERYVTQHFDGICDLFRSDDLIAQHYFGLFDPDPRLYDRVGDYVLIMRDNYILKDFLAGEEEKFHIGNHGGLSPEEMFVPLIVIEV